MPGQHQPEIIPKKNKEKVRGIFGVVLAGLAVAGFGAGMTGYLNPSLGLWVMFLACCLLDMGDPDFPARRSTDTLVENPNCDRHRYRDVHSVYSVAASGSCQT